MKVLGNKLPTISAKPVGVGATSQLIPTGERSGLLMRIRGDGKRLVVHADDKLTAFLELEAAIRNCSQLRLTTRRDFLQTRR